MSPASSVCEHSWQAFAWMKREEEPPCDHPQLVMAFVHRQLIALSIPLGGYALPEFLVCLCAVVVASVHQQLMASSNNTKVVGMLRFNIDSEVDSTRVVGADWVPRQNGQFFVVGHLSGRVYLYNKVQIHSIAMECFVILLFTSPFTP